jgi:hypothetical protein
MARVVFTFDESSLETLKQVQEQGAFSSMGTAVRDAVELTDVLQDQVKNGFTEVIVRNPQTNQEKTLVVPSLQRVLKKTTR